MGQIILKKQIPQVMIQHASKTIVAACGCFDIFHIGHLDYLEGAKCLGDFLIVGINSDESILKNKGKTPIFQEEQRISVINALQCVDYAFIFHEKTFTRSLNLIKPHIFARGIDAESKGFPERTTVDKNNIKIVVVGDYKKSSSRELRSYFHKEKKEIDE